MKSVVRPYPNGIHVVRCPRLQNPLSGEQLVHKINEADHCVVTSNPTVPSLGTSLQRILYFADRNQRPSSTVVSIGSFKQ